MRFSLVLVRRKKSSAREVEKRIVTVFLSATPDDKTAFYSPLKFLASATRGTMEHVRRILEPRGERKYRSSTEG